jgi:hypothetical protein
MTCRMLHVGEGVKIMLYCISNGYGACAARLLGTRLTAIIFVTDPLDFEISR